MFDPTGMSSGDLIICDRGGARRGRTGQKGEVDGCMAGGSRPPSDVDPDPNRIGGPTSSFRDSWASQSSGGLADGLVGGGGGFEETLPFRGGAGEGRGEAGEGLDEFPDVSIRFRVRR